MLDVERYEPQISPARKQSYVGRPNACLASEGNGAIRLGGGKRIVQLSCSTYNLKTAG